MNEIFVLLRQNDQNGLKKLYNIYYNKMYGIAFLFVKNEQMSEDIIHNVMYKLLTMDTNLFPSTNETTWLYKVIKNEALMLLRKESKTISLELIDEVLIEDKSINEYVDMEAFYSIIKPLNEERQKIVTLKILGDYSHKEIAQILGKPIGTIQWLYNTSIKKLRTILSSLMGVIIMLFGASVIECIRYIQDIFKSSGKPGGKQNFYIDYLLLYFILLALTVVVLFIVIYKKNHKPPTKPTGKSI